MTNIVEVVAWSYLSFPHKMDPMKTTGCLKNIYYFKKKKRLHSNIILSGSNKLRIQRIGSSRIIVTYRSCSLGIILRPK